MNNKEIKITSKCPIRTCLELLGGKWKLLIVYQLRSNPLRLSELRKQIPEISEKMLIQELKFLVDSNLVTRTNFGEVPPRVEYSLTPKGYLAMPLIEEMNNFSAAYIS